MKRRWGIAGSLLMAVGVITLAAQTSLPAVASSGSRVGDPGPVFVTVDCAKVVNAMRGGLGASWHAMETLIPYGVKHPVFDSYSHGGSGWGGYPPAEDERAWQQIYRHADWLGLDWNRVEVEQRIYEPERGVFTFDSPEMRILYRILDWQQKRQAEVFFQQMWCNTPWLAYPEFRDDPVGRVHSAPVDLEAFADGLATLMEHLIRKRGYTCIKWLCISNEPGAGFSWWQAPPNKPLSIAPGLAAVRKALDQRGLKLPLSGPDTTTAFPAQAPGDLDYRDLLGAYDFHDYSADFDFRTRGHITTQERNAAHWAAFAHGEGKPVFLSEFGTMAYGWLPDKPGPGSPPSVLAGSELVVRLANAGVDGFNRWSFLNRGDLDGQWQLVDTWDPQAKTLLAEFRPHPNSYFCLGLLSRFTAQHSAILASHVDGGKLDDWQRVFCAAFLSPAGNLTLALVNDAPVEFQVKLALRGMSQAVRLHRYRYGAAQQDRADVEVNPQAEMELKPEARELQDTLPAGSLTIYSTYKLEHDLPGVMVEEPKQIISHAQSVVPAVRPVSQGQIDVAAIYFPGFHRDTHYDAWFGEGWNEWQLLAEAPTRFPGQQFFKPQWGPFDEADPKWMERQIALAADHGITVFIFDWYWYSGVKILHRPLEEGFLKAGNRERLQYALMWANHNWGNYFPVPIDRPMHQLLPIRHSAADFTRVMDECIKLHFRQPNYWRVGSGPYFSIFDPWAFLQQLGGPEKTRAVLDAARQQVASAGLGRVHFAAFTGGADGVPQLQAAGFDSTTCYNVTASGKARLPEQPLDDYADLMERHKAFWKEMDAGLLPYAPTVTVGWDPSPRWVKDTPWPLPADKGYPYSTLVVNNTPERFGALFRSALQHAESARLRPPAVVINAWNEWTEGSVLLPDVKYETRFLEEVRNALQQK